jgi:hypothetical protein
MILDYGGKRSATPLCEVQIIPRQENQQWTKQNSAVPFETAPLKFDS